MRATRTPRTTGRTHPGAHKAAPKPVGKSKVAIRPPQPAPQPVPFRMCKPGWAVMVEKVPAALGTRFVCPFCPLSHRVPGPVRGFRRVRRAQWVKLRRVHE